MLVSAVVHGSVVAALLWMGWRAEPLRPPVYRVSLIGAPPGPRQAGVVQPDNKPAAEAPTVAGAERVPVEKALPTPKNTKSALASPKATPSTDRSRKAGAKTATAATNKNTAAPKAGAGAQGGKGADVANINTRGIDFPFPGYLQNIVRQLTLNWSPQRVSAALVSEIKFLIRRDGTVVGIEVMKSSRDRIYDLDAMGAVEAVGSTRGFGPLPAGWSDDVLVVYFTFDYALRPN